jgi:hypothetical protein
MGGGMNWVAVSDVNAPELRRFVEKLAAEVRAASANGQKSRLPFRVFRRM